MDFDLYDDLLLGDKISEKENELKLENEELKAKNIELSQKLRTLSNLNKKLSEDMKIIEVNFSSLLKTSRNEINRKAEAMIKLKGDMDKLIFQQAIRTGTKTEYEKVFEAFKESLELFEPRRCIVTEICDEKVVDDLRVTNDENVATVVFGNSSISILKNSSFWSSRSVLKRHREPDKENSCIHPAKKQKTLHPEKSKSRSTESVEIVKGSRKPLERSCNKILSPPKTKSSTIPSRSSSNRERTREEEKRSHQKRSKEREDRRERGTSSRRRSPPSRESYRSEKSANTVSQRISNQDSRSNRSQGREVRRSSRGRTSTDRLAESKSKEAAYRHEKVDRREPELRTSKRRSDSKVSDTVSKDSLSTFEKNKSSFSRERRGEKASSVRLESEKVLEEPRRQSLSSNKGGKSSPNLSTKTKENRHIEEKIDKGPEAKLNEIMPENNHEKFVQRDLELKDGEIILGVQPCDLIDMGCNSQKCGKPLRPSQKLNCELFSESEDENTRDLMPTLVSKKSSTEGKNSKNLPADLSDIDSVDLRSMIEEKKRQMSQLEKKKVKYLKKMKQPCERLEKDLTFDGLKIRISLPKDNSSESYTLEPSAFNNSSNKQNERGTSKRGISVTNGNVTAGVSSIDHESNAVLISPDVVKNILKSDKLQPTNQSLLKDLSLSITPKSDSNISVTSLEKPTPRRSPRKAVSNISCGSNIKFTTNKQSTSTIRPNIRDKIDKQATESEGSHKTSSRKSMGNKVAEISGQYSSDMSDEAEASNRQSHVRTLKFSPEFKNLNTESKPTSAHQGEDDSLKRIPGTDEISVLKNVTITKAKPSKSVAKRTANFSLHTSVLASIESPCEVVHDSESENRSEKFTSQKPSQDSLVTSLGLDLSSDEDDRGEKL